MPGERVRLRHSNPDVKGEWDCPVAAVPAWRGRDWVPVSEWHELKEQISEPVSARKSRKENDG